MTIDNIFYICSSIIVLILFYLLWILLRDAPRNEQELFCIKRETWNQLTLYFIYGIFFGIVAITQYYLLSMYFNPDVFLIFNLIICIVGIISIILFYKEFTAPIQKFCYFIFIIGFFYGIIDIGLLLTANTNWIITLGFGFPFIHTLVLLIFSTYVVGSVLINYYKLKSLEMIRNPNLTSQHRGIIIVLLKNPLLNFSIFGIDTLIEICRHRQEPYAIYFCYTTNEIKTIFFRLEINKIWIFAHGIFHGINTDDDNFYYCELEHGPPKDEIAQMHCNCYGGKSAADYLIRPFDERKCIIKKGLRNAYQENKKDIQKFFENRDLQQ